MVAWGCFRTLDMALLRSGFGVLVFAPNNRFMFAICALSDGCMKPRRCGGFGSGKGRLEAVLVDACIGKCLTVHVAFQAWR